MHQSVRVSDNHGANYNSFVIPDRAISFAPPPSNANERSARSALLLASETRDNRQTDYRAFYIYRARFHWD